MKLMDFQNMEIQLPPPPEFTEPVTILIPGRNR
jgi:hypothetical protein